MSLADEEPMGGQSAVNVSGAHVCADIAILDASYIIKGSLTGGRSAYSALNRMMNKEQLDAVFRVRQTPKNNPFGHRISYHFVGFLHT